MHGGKLKTDPFSLFPALPSEAGGALKEPSPLELVTGSPMARHLKG